MTPVAKPMVAPDHLISQAPENESFRCPVGAHLKNV
jgi:hypothetical protein